MLSTGGQCRVHRGGDGHLDDGPLRDSTLAGIVVGRFEILAARADVDCATMLRARFFVSRTTQEIGQLVDSEVDLGTGTRIVNAVDSADESVRECRFGDQPAEGLVGVNVAGDPSGGDRGAVDDHPGDPVAIGFDLLHSTSGTDFDTPLDSSSGQGIGKPSHASLDIAPDASCSAG